MKILFLCNKKIYDSKMSRVRFHGIDAIKRVPGVTLTKHGIGWGNFDIKRLERELKPDLIIWYKPLKILGYNDVNTPTCLRYNEMWSKSWTKHEIKGAKSKLVICHHFNDIKRYADNLDPQYKLVHNPHCGETEIFKDYGHKKDIDVLYIGIGSRTVYPLRRKFDGPVKRILRSKGVRFQVHSHPGYDLNGESEIKRQTIQYAQMINRAKIVVSCASIYKYALAKYVEVPLCRSVLCGNVPDENQEWYRKWMLPVSMDYNASTIAGRIIDLLNDPKRLKHLTETGYEENLKHRTQEHYAKRFVKIAEDFLNGRLDSYDFAVDSEKYLNGGEGEIS